VLRGPISSAFEALPNAFNGGPQVRLAKLMDTSVGTAGAMPAQHVRHPIVKLDWFAGHAGGLIGERECVLDGSLFIDEDVEHVHQAELDCYETRARVEGDEATQARWPTGTLQVTSAVERMESRPSDLISVANIVEPAGRVKESDVGWVDSHRRDACPVNDSEGVPQAESVVS
jgi:hypothetical protein